MFAPEQTLRKKVEDHDCDEIVYYGYFFEE